MSTGETEMDAQQKKLKEAKAKILAVLKEYDLAGFVTMYGPGWGEVFWDLWPSYSILVGDFPSVRVVSRAKDYEGKEAGAQYEDQKRTVEMMSHLATSSGEVSLQFLELAGVLDAKFNAEHKEPIPFPEPSEHNPGAH